jgi:hypothetical protein
MIALQIQSENSKKTLTVQPNSSHTTNKLPQTDCNLTRKYLKFYVPQKSSCVNSILSQYKNVSSQILQATRVRRNQKNQKTNMKTYSAGKNRN